MPVIQGKSIRRNTYGMIADLLYAQSIHCMKQHFSRHTFIEVNTYITGSEHENINT